MDLAHFRAHPQQLAMFLKHQRVRETPVEGGSICKASRLTFDNGESLFTKTLENPPVGFFHAEAAGLRWLARTNTVSVPEVLVEQPDLLGLTWIEPGPPSPGIARRFGRELAAMHRTGTGAFGAPWAGFHGSVPMDNTQTTQPWHIWYAERRLTAYLRMSLDRGALEGADVALVERVIARIEPCAEPPSPIHGDLWSGNLIWGADGRCHLVDPAAHGGHRETDLTYLALWGGIPHLAEVLTAYQEEFPLAAGWRERVPLHQLSMYLLHTALFGTAFASGVRDTATACLAGRATVRE